MILHLDCETYSLCDLKRAGVHAYAEHPSTGVWCVAFAFDDEPVQVWVPGEPCPVGVLSHAYTAGEVWAHNAVFERLILNSKLLKYGWPYLAIEQTHCTMAMAHAMNLPGALDRCASALGLPQRKDSEGRRIMLQLAQPDKDGNFLTPATHPEKHARLREYCKQDVVVERAIGERLLQLSSSERMRFVLDQDINDRGIAVDRPAAIRAAEIAEAEGARLNERLSRITGGALSSINQNVAMVKYLRAHGCEISSVAKDEVATVLDAPDDLHPAVREVLTIRQEAAKSSVKKIDALLEGWCADGRLRGTMQYHGAGQTGRWSGRRFQPHNLPRPSLSPDTIAWLLDRNLAPELLQLFGEPLSVLSDCLRGLLVAAPGREFLSADLSQIEARVLAWLAGDEEGLRPFREGGKVYETEAAKIYKVPVEEITKGDPRRQIGKVAILALGYGGGAGAFRTMGAAYGVKVSEEEANGIKRAWREAHRPIVNYWRWLEDAAIGAALHPGQACTAGPPGRQITFKKNGSFLLCKLPSGRVIVYPYPKVIRKLTPWETETDCLTYQTVHETGGEWARTDTWGGKLSENITQAVSRDVLADALVRCAERGWRIVLHVHDEVVIEAPIGAVDLAELNRVVALPPAWALDLPVGSEGWKGPRYRK